MWCDVVRHTLQETKIGNMRCNAFVLMGFWLKRQFLNQQKSVISSVSPFRELNEWSKAEEKNWNSRNYITYEHVIQRAQYKCKQFSGLYECNSKRMYSFENHTIYKYTRMVKPASHTLSKTETHFFLVRLPHRQTQWMTHRHLICPKWAHTFFTE